jgi:hypothetical protein
MKTRLILIATILMIAITTGYGTAAESISGCLKGPNSEGVFDLTNTQEKQKIEVGGNPDLAAHVGHTVKLTGEWVKSGKDIGEKEEAGGKEEENERHFKVSGVEHVAAGCAK